MESEVGEEGTWGREGTAGEYRWTSDKQGCGKGIGAERQREGKDMWEGDCVERAVKE